MGRRRQKRSEKAESGKMARPGPRSTQVEGNCWESQDSSRVVALKKKKKNLKQRLEDTEMHTSVIKLMNLY